MNNQANQALSELEKNLKIAAKNNKKYEIKEIIDSIMYGQQANNIIPGLYYLIS